MVHESECGALGAAIRDGEAAELVVSELALEDFYSSANQAVWKALCGLSGDGLTVNPVSVSERSGVNRSDVDALLAQSVGIGNSQLQTLISDVKRVGGLRAVFTACSNAAAQVGTGSKLEDIVSIVEKGIYATNRDGSEPKDGSDVMGAVVDDFLRRHKEGGGPEISTGLRDLDRALIGLRPGKLGIIAARPSMGKTALASTIRRAVLAQGYGVIEFALEMSAEELMERELSYAAQLNLTKVLRAKDITDEELGRVRAARADMVSGRWRIDDRTYNIAGMRRKARVEAGRMARAGIKVGAVIIDYIQLAGDNGEGREQSIAAISRGAKFLAKELGCTVLALSQLNRQCEFRDDHRPMMSDLRESGSIEQDSDWVGFVYREHMYDQSADPGDTEFIIRKQRSGPIGTVRLKFDPKTTNFSNIDPVVNMATPVSNAN